MKKESFSEVKLFVDGCSRGNPGQAGVGYVIKSLSGEILSEGSKFLGNRLTNNQAEYKAAILGLDECLKICKGKIYVLSDSELIIKQMTGVYRINDEKLKELFLAKRFPPLF